MMHLESTIAFTDAFCVAYELYFSAVGAAPFSLSILITARKLDINSLVYENYWPQISDYTPQSEPERTAKPAAPVERGSVAKASSAASAPG